VDMHVARLRDKLRDDPAEPKLVVTIRGKGYRWTAGKT
jgi:DNA-binding response OmpR family regulator